MTRKMPGRPLSHELEEGSKRAFTAALPVSWIATPPTGDYGVDLDVEIFQDGVATGIHFKVQLKGKAKVARSPSVSLKHTTRNYWRELDLPTLVVLWDAATERIWWKWSHMIDPYGSKPNTESLTVHFDNEWTDNTPDLIFRELTARRAIRTITANIPLFVQFSNESDFLGGTPRGTIAALHRLLQEAPELIFNSRRTTDATLDVKFEANDVTIRLVGSTQDVAHFGELRNRVDSVLEEEIAADIAVMIAMMLGRAGAGQLSVDLLKKSAATSSFAIKVGLIGDIIAELIRSRQVPTVIVLLGRTYFQEETDAAFEAIAALKQRQHLLSLGDAREIADAFRAAAASSPYGAELLYNAAGLLPQACGTAARELLEEAAALDPSYMQRPHWWSDKAATYFFEADFVNAARCYASAVDLGEAASIPLLADARLWMGDYEGAIALWGNMDTDTAPLDPEWRLKYFAFEYLTSHLGIANQQRDPDAADAALAQATEMDVSVSIEALKHDLLASDALWMATHFERAATRPTLPFFLAAAFVKPRNLWLWEESVYAARDEFPEMITYILMCIKKMCGEDFEIFLQTNPDVDPKSRAWFQTALQLLPDPAINPVVFRAGVGIDTL